MFSRQLKKYLLFSVFFLLIIRINGFAFEQNDEKKKILNDSLSVKDTPCFLLASDFLNYKAGAGIDNIGFLGNIHSPSLEDVKVDCQGEYIGLKQFKYYKFFKEGNEKFEKSATEIE